MNAIESFCRAVSSLNGNVEFSCRNSVRFELGGECFVFQLFDDWCLLWKSKMLFREGAISCTDVNKAEEMLKNLSASR